MRVLIAYSAHYSINTASGHFIDLINTFVVPTFRRNLVFVSIVDKFGYTCTFGNRKFSIDLASISTNTWGLDSGATIHVSMSMQGCLHCWKPRSKEKYVFTGNDTSAIVEGIETFRLLLNTGHFVDLINTFVVPTVRRNLVSVSTLEKFGYFCTFGKIWLFLDFWK